LTDEEQAKLFTVAQSKPKYRWVYVLLVLGYYCGMRPCESLALKWRDIDFVRRILTIRRSKTEAGWRDPSLNSVCMEALQILLDQARSLGIAQPDHYVFPYHPRGRFRKSTPPFDPSRPMTKYARQWNEIKKRAGLQGMWFYDGRHTARTKMAEMGMPDEVMDAQMGHVSKLVGKRYSHIRRLALERAAAALEPSAKVRQVLMITPEVDKNATVQ
jgi:integrase